VNVDGAPLFQGAIAHLADALELQVKDAGSNPTGNMDPGATAASTSLGFLPGATGAGLVQEHKTGHRQDLKNPRPLNRPPCRRTFLPFSAFQPIQYSTRKPPNHSTELFFSTSVHITTLHDAPFVLFSLPLCAPLTTIPTAYFSLPHLCIDSLLSASRSPCATG